MTRTRGRRAGFSAFEMGLCFLAIAVASLVVFQWSRFAMSRGRDVCCSSNLHQLALAMQMYSNDYGGRGPAKRAAGVLNVYTRNQQILVCPSYVGAPQQPVDTAEAEPRGPEDLRPTPGPMQVAVGYEFRLNVWNDEPPGTVVVQDIASGMHTRQTWQAARLDGAVQRLPADQWKTLR